MLKFLALFIQCYMSSYNNVGCRETCFENYYTRQKWCNFIFNDFMIKPAYVLVLSLKFYLSGAKLLIILRLLR